MEKYYLDPKFKVYRIRVTRYGDFFRASTNEEETYMKYLDKLEYCKTKEEAQKQLNDLAKLYNWELDTRDKKY